MNEDITVAIQKLPSGLTGGNWAAQKDVRIVHRAKFENNLNSPQQGIMEINALELLISECYLKKMS